MFAFGTSDVLDEVPASVRLPGGVSASPTVNEIAPVVVSSLMVFAEIAVLVGGLLLTPVKVKPLSRVPDGPTGFTVTSAAPAACAGVVAVIVVELTSTTLVASV